MADSSIASVFSSNTIDIGNSGTALASVIGSGKNKNMTMQQVDAAAQDFESMFVSQMMEPMFGESSGEEAFGGQASNDVYKSMMMDQYGKIIARSGGIGIAAYIKQELLKQQEVPSPHLLRGSDDAANQTPQQVRGYRGANL